MHCRKILSETLNKCHKFSIGIQNERYDVFQNNLTNHFGNLGKHKGRSRSNETRFFPPQELKGKCSMKLGILKKEGSYRFEFNSILFNKFLKNFLGGPCFNSFPSPHVFIKDGKSF